MYRRDQRSGDPSTSVKYMMNFFRDSGWAPVVIAPSAVLIGVPVGPMNAAHASSAPLQKCASRLKEIGGLGMSSSSSFAIASVLAVPVLHHVAQFYPIGKRGRHISQVGMQALLHLPHRGFGSIVLCNLALVGLYDFVAVDIIFEGVALRAAQRLAPHVRECIGSLCEAFAYSDASPPASLAASFPYAPDSDFTPIGWDGPAFASAILANGTRDGEIRPELRVLYDGEHMRELRDQYRRPPSGPAFGRALVPLCTLTIVCQALPRILALWLPLAVLGSSPFSWPRPTATRSRGSALRKTVGRLAVASSPNILPASSAGVTRAIGYAT